MAETEVARRLVGDEDAVLHRAAQRRAQILLRQLRRRAKQRVRHIASGGGRETENVLCRPVEPGDALHEHVAQAGWKLRPLVAGRGDELLGEERVAFAPGGDRVRHPRRQRALGACRDQFRQGAVLERTEIEHER